MFRVRPLHGRDTNRNIWKCEISDPAWSLKRSKATGVHRVANASPQRYGNAMPVEKWSDTVLVAHLSDDPQFSDDLSSIEDSIDAVSKDAVLDFAAVQFVNSSNLARLLKLRKQMSTNNRRLMLCSISTKVWGAFLVTGLDKIFQFSDNVPTALATLQMA
jgi:anti-anti-sigma factor